MPYAACTAYFCITMPPEEHTFLTKKGIYRDLLAYRKSEILFDLTCNFCRRFVQKGDRTVDQMI